MVLRRGLSLAAAGAARGLTGALVGSHLMSGSLYGVSPTNVPIFAAVTVALTAVALAGSYIPALRAMRLDPITTLRSIDHVNNFLRIPSSIRSGKILGSVVNCFASFPTTYRIFGLFAVNASRIASATTSGELPARSLAYARFVNARSMSAYRVAPAGGSDRITPSTSPSVFSTAGV